MYASDRFGLYLERGSIWEDQYLNEFEGFEGADKRKKIEAFRVSIYRMAAFWEYLREEDLTKIHTLYIRSGKETRLSSQWSAVLSDLN